MLDNITRLFLYKIRLYENINGVVVVFELLRDRESKTTGACDTVYFFAVLYREMCEYCPKFCV